MSIGIVMWSASGSPNNYGIKPVPVVGFISLAAGQNTGSWSFPVPAGHKLDVIEVPTGYAYDAGERYVSVSGNTISLSPVGGGNFRMLANPGYIIVYIQRT